MLHLIQAPSFRDVETGQIDRPVIAVSPVTTPQASRPKTRLWHYFLVISISILVAELLWYIVNPSQMTIGVFIGIIVVFMTMAIYLFLYKGWKQIW